jgi:hypothetical protein
LASIIVSFTAGKENNNSTVGEVLYNGIQLPTVWPPHNIDPASDDPMPIPYLKNIPEVISIDIGRQLFVDDFLIEEMTLKRQFHLAQKYEGNPIFKPETDLELNEKGNAIACPKSGGVWWDPQIEHFRMWYEAGWVNTICYAESSEGLKWERPDLDIQSGTNKILDPNITPDSLSIFPDYEKKDSQQRWKIFLQSPGAFDKNRARCMISDDGVHWSKPVLSGPAGDRSTMFYNPFRKKCVYSLRSYARGRSRHYWEHDDFLKGAAWQHWDTSEPNTPVFWTAADRLDRPDPNLGQQPQLYNLDAVAYESIMLGLYQIHRGLENEQCMRTGKPKITDLELAYSRDGFHWYRPDRRAFIPSSRTDTWDRGYVQSVGGVCLVQGDKLWFYYVGFKGNTNKLNEDWHKNGMYDNGSTGIAFLRRDGFASVDSKQKNGYLLTRPVKFGGKYLFVNVDNPKGYLKVEVLDSSGMVVEPFTKENCITTSVDITIHQIKWDNVRDLSCLVGKKVRFKFYLGNGSLYSFWVSPDESGASYGYVAAGGIGFSSYIDTLGSNSYKVASRNKD